MNTGRHDGFDAPGPRGDRVIDGGLLVERPPGLRGIRRFSHEAMATIFEVLVIHDDERYAAQASAAAFAVADNLEAGLSRFRQNSDIGRINGLAAGAQVIVSPTTLECLVIARHLFDLTQGAFDVSIGTGLQTLALDPEGMTVQATRGGVTLDLGGIGKGYAVDRMAQVLEEWGLANALVHGGFSSMLALDPPAGLDGWPLTLSDPARPFDAIVRLSSRQAALGASGVRKGGHILNPRTGEAVTGRRAAWVLVPRPPAEASGAADEEPPAAAATVADALATAFMLMRPEAIEALCDASPGLEAWVLADVPAAPGEAPGLAHFGAPGPPS